ncbi:MAG TPA: hypothetical protein VF383_15325 [Candidatus Dormibacteraeota bacterium]
MASFKVLVIVPVWVVLMAANPALPTSSPSPVTTPTPQPSPTPSPIPINANVILDTAAGGPNTQITVTGSSFLPNESMNLVWDLQSHIATSVTADGNGNFTKVVTPFPGDGPGPHRLCASVPPVPCAYFTLQGSPTPTPSAPASPSPVPSDSPSPSPSDSPSPVVLTTNSGRGGFDVITKPPFVFLPIIGLLAILAALAYWLLMRVDRTPVLPMASVVHRSARPDIGPLPTKPSAPTPAPEAQPPPADVPPPPDAPSY